MNAKFPLNLEMSIFGSSTQNTNSSNPFGGGTSSIFGQSSQQNQQPLNSFLNAGTTNSTSQPQQKSLFGTLGQPAPQPATQSGGLFGQAQPQQSGGLFGQSQPQQSNNLFGNAQNSTAPQQGSSLFGKAQAPAQSGLFAPQQQPQPSIFNPNATQQQQQQPSIQQTSLFGPQPSLFKQTEVWPRKIFFNPVTTMSVS